MTALNITLISVLGGFAYLAVGTVTTGVLMATWCTDSGQSHLSIPGGVFCTLAWPITGVALLAALWSRVIFRLGRRFNPELKGWNRNW